MQDDYFHNGNTSQLMITKR